VVRAHPTVPILTPLNCRFNPNCFQAAATFGLLARGPAVLANPDTFTHNSVKFCAGGADVDFSSKTFSVWIAVGRCTFDIAGRRSNLHPRTGAGLYRRRVPALQRRDSRRQPRDRLHGRKTGPVVTALPRLLQV
jgi:hypothetical protein